jgi:hypothetical protein
MLCVHRIPLPTLVTIAKRPSRRRGTGANVPVIWGPSQQTIPKIGTDQVATDWHDGQFSHDAYAQVSLGLSGKSVPGQSSNAYVMRIMLSVHSTHPVKAALA